jgi:hypothetical protein
MAFDFAAFVRLIARSTPGHRGHVAGIAADIDDARYYFEHGMAGPMRLAVTRAVTVSLLIDRGERYGSLAEFERALGDASELVGLPRPTAISRTWRAELTTAVVDDHHCADRSCGICEAVNNGWAHVAAALLIGATDAPRTSAVLHRWGLGSDLLESEDWVGWVAHVKRYGRRCESCRAVTFADDVHEPDACAACGHPLSSPG